ncbi:MAG TPA: hypothetical protein VMT76_10415 [Puia sp.]|nr:hypothetical protein [Puia sp.]
MNKQKKILLVQLYSNGDCLYATAIARQIKKDYPGCTLTWAIASFCKNIILNNPYIDHVLEVTEVIKDKVTTYRKFKKKIIKRKKDGEWDEIFFTNLIDDQQANYDGSIRSSIFRGYNLSITTPITPVLELLPDEKKNVTGFVDTHQLNLFKNVLLFEFAPQSKQSAMTPSLAIEIAEKITKDKSIAVILSSALKINHSSPNIIDGSILSLRETAFLTNYCTLLLGSSSGITWASTSSTAKLLPMIQLLDIAAKSWANPVSRDFNRFGISSEKLIELTSFNQETVVDCVRKALYDFKEAKKIYHQQFPVHFNASRNIVYNLLCYANFGAIIRHIKINISVYGYRMSFFKEVIAGFLIFPFRLIRNLTQKRH